MEKSQRSLGATSEALNDFVVKVARRNMHEHIAVEHVQYATAAAAAALCGFFNICSADAAAVRAKTQRCTASCNEHNNRHLKE